MTNAKFSSSLPSGDQNGLGPIIPALLDRPDKPQVIIAVVDNKATVTDNDTGSTVPTLRLRRVETVLRIDLPRLEQMLRRSVEARCGMSVLPLDLEEEIAAVFAGIDDDEEVDDDG